MKIFHVSRPLEIMHVVKFSEKGKSVKKKKAINRTFKYIFRFKIKMFLTF